MVLGLDLSSANSGWAIINKKGKLMAYGNFKSKPKMSQEEKIAFMFKSFQSLLDKYKISNIAIEDQFCGKNVNTLKLLSKIAGAVIALATVHNLSIKIYPPKYAKKMFTGSGAASKEEVEQRVLELYKIENYDDNTTDAISIAYIAKEEIWGRGK